MNTQYKSNVAHGNCCAIQSLEVSKCKIKAIGVIIPPLLMQQLMHSQESAISLDNFENVVGHHNAILGSLSSETSKQCWSQVSLQTPTVILIEFSVY